jgi:cytochrome P450
LLRNLISLGTIPKAAPGPRGYPLLGVLAAAWQDPLQFFLNAALRYGDVVSMRMGLHQVYLISHPKHIQHVLQDNFHNYRKGGRIDAIKPLFGEGLTTSEGDLWRRQRDRIQPAFHPQQIAGLAAVMTDATGVMLERWQRAAERRQPLDMAAEMMRLTREIAFRALFGADVRGEADEVGRALAAVLEHINHRAWALLDLSERLPTPRNRRFQHALRRLDALVYRMIRERRQGGQSSGDLLSALLWARDRETGEGMSDGQLRDEVLTLFVAGHQTTASALAWTWVLLSTHPGVEHRLKAELIGVLGGRPPTYGDLPNLTYTRMVIEEALRLYPPTWITARTPKEDDEIGGYRIPANSVILLSPYVTQRHPTFWEDPEVFDPERFAPTRPADRPRYAYFPFGGGPRICIGKGFALMETQLIVAMVAQKYHLSLVPGYPVEPEPAITLHPRYGVQMSIRHHSHAPGCL